MHGKVLLYVIKNLRGSLDTQDGSLWHEITGVATPHNSPRHRGGEPWLSGPDLSALIGREQQQGDIIVGPDQRRYFASNKCREGFKVKIEFL